MSDIDKQIDEIFKSVLNKKHCIADHNDFGGDVIITWTGVWCENCEKPIGDLLPLEDLLSDEKITQIRQAISTAVREAQIREVDRLQRLMGDCYDGHNDLFNKRLAQLKEEVQE